MMKCPECNKYFSDDYQDLEQHLNYSHFLSYQSYLENTLTENKEKECCYKCGSPKQSLTWIDPDFYYLPCWDCIKRKSYRLEAKNDIINNIKTFYKRILGDRHLQLFLIDDIYGYSTIPHRYTAFREVLKLLPVPKDRDDIWFLDWNYKYYAGPKIMCPDTVEGILIENLTDRFSDKIINEEDKIIVGDYVIEFPEKVPFEFNHYYRYNILNKTANSRKTKRLKIISTVKGEEVVECVKFFNTVDDNWKSIFRITKNDEPVDIREIDKQYFLIIKLAIFRNKAASRLIFDIIYEIIKKVEKFRDGVFLKNTVTIDPDKEIDLNLCWTISDNNNEFINISIL